jgi:hypothetical protein
MRRAMILSAAWISIGSSMLGCTSPAGASRDLYRPVGFQETVDPLAPRPTVLPWRPPRQMAAFIHPHEDRTQGILIGDGSWYFEDAGEKDPVPDAEATPAERQAGLRALDLPQGSVIPYAPAGEKKR